METQETQHTRHKEIQDTGESDTDTAQDTYDTGGGCLLLSRCTQRVPATLGGQCNAQGHLRKGGASTGDLTWYQK